MADNITLNTGSGGATLRTDDDGTAQWQYIKIAFGADNTQTIVGSISSNPFPVALSATDNAVLDQIEVNTSYGDNTGGGVESGALRVTIANDSTGLVSVDDNGGSLTIDNADITTIAGAVSGSEMQVDIVSGNVTNAGTFAIQEDGAALTALQLIDDSIFADDAAFTLTSSKMTVGGGIRDDSLTTLTAIEGDAVPFRFGSTGALHVTGGGGGTEYTEDVATANPIVGSATLMERDDALTTVTPIEGDWIGLRGTAEGALWTEDFNSDAALTALQLIDDPVFADNAGFTLSTSKVMVAGGVFQSGTPGTLADNDAGAVLLNSTAGQMVELMAGAASIGTLGANSGVDIGDVDVTSVISGTGATNLGKAQDTAVGGTDTGVAMLVQRDDEQAAVTPVDGDYVVPRCDRFGNIKTTNLPDATSEVKYGVINVAGSGDNTLQAAAGAGIKIRVLAMAYTCGGTVNVRIESGASGTALTGIQEWIVNTGMVLPWNPAGWFETADNTLLNMELSGAVNVDGCFTYVEV